MTTATCVRRALFGVTMLLAMSSAANATGVARTWVSSAGNDANTSSSCTRTSPCRTFASAYSVTAPGGEIVALDSIGYGPVTITTSVTIIGLEGALVSVQSSTVGVTINAAATDVVLLRNIQFSGASGSSNTVGVKLNTGKLVLQDSSFHTLTDGLLVDSANNGNSIVRAYLTNNQFVGNTHGVTTNGNGIDFSIANPTGNIEVLISGGNFLANTTVFQTNNPGLDQNSNQKYPILIERKNQGGWSVNIVGYTNYAAGTGTGCGSCNTIQDYSSSTGAQPPF